MLCCAPPVANQNIEALEPEEVGSRRKEPLQEEKPQPETNQDFAPETQAEAVPEPAPSALIITFSEAGVPRTIVFERRPLGFRFKKETPIVVTGVNEGSTAEALGVRPGMEVTAIGGEAVGKKSYGELSQMILDFSAFLPVA